MRQKFKNSRLPPRACELACATVLALSLLPVALAHAQDARRPTAGNGLFSTPQPPDVGDENGLTIPGEVPFTTTIRRSGDTPDGASSGNTSSGPVIIQGREVIEDGDLLSAQSSSEQQDGIVSVPSLDTVLAPADAPDQVDQRNAEDIAAFENPPAGFNAQLFTIDDISLETDRRIRRLFTQEVEPFDPVGIRFGSFVAFPELEIAGNAQTNLLSAPDDTPDTAFETLASLRVVSDWSNHAVEFRGAYNGSRHGTFETEDENGYELEGRGRLDIRRFTNVQGLISRRSFQESRSAVDAAQVGPRATVVQDRGEGALNHRFNRLRIRLRGGITSEEFGSDIDALSGSAIESDRDNHEREIAMRASWEFKPTLTAFAEVEGNHRDFQRAAGSDGLSRNSTGTRYRAGVSFGQTGAYLRGELALGYGKQDLDASALDDVDGLIFDASLAWRATGLTTVLFNVDTDFQNTTTGGSGGVLSRRYELGLRHTFRPYLIGTASFEISDQSFAGIGLDEREVAYNLGVEYYLRREAVLFGTFQRTVFNSDFENEDFDDTAVRFGLRLRR